MNHILQDTIENGSDVAHFPMIHWTGETISKFFLGFHLKIFDHLFQIDNIEQKPIKSNDFEFTTDYRIRFQFLRSTYYMKLKTTYFSVFFLKSYFQLGNIKVYILFNSEKSYENTYLNYQIFVNKNISHFNMIFLYLFYKRVLQIFVSIYEIFILLTFF